MKGHTVHEVVHRYTGIERKHLRITKGCKEIYPTNWSTHWQQNDKLEVKLKLMGGGRDAKTINMKQQAHEAGR